MQPDPNGSGGGGGGGSGVPDPETQAEIDAFYAALDRLIEHPFSVRARRNFEEAQQALFSPDEPPCVEFDPPASGRCPLEPAWRSCPTPCVGPEQPCSIDALPVDDAAGAYDVYWEVTDPSVPPDDDMLLLVQQAWALLMANTDLVDWIACLYYGESASSPKDAGEWFAGLIGVSGSLAECLVDKINGEAPKVLISFVADGDDFMGRSDGFGGSIVIPYGHTSDFSTKYVATFQNVAGSENEFCIVADLAATLLHELVHSCSSGGRSDQPGSDEVDQRGECATSYLVENSFRWALGQRYPCLLTTTHCSYYGDACVWRNDWSASPARTPCV